MNTLFGDSTPVLPNDVIWLISLELMPSLDDSTFDDFTNLNRIRSTSKEWHRYTESFVLPRITAIWCHRYIDDDGVSVFASYLRKFKIGFPNIFRCKPSYAIEVTDDGISKMTRLQSLKLHPNQSIEPQSVNRLTTLKKLALYNGCVNVSSWIEPLSLLESLEIKGNYTLTVQDMTCIARLKKLSLTGFITINPLHSLTQLTSLEHLRLGIAYHDLDDYNKPLRFIPDTLRSLDISRGATLTSLNRLTNLETLVIGKIDIHLDTIVLFRELPKLTKLVFRYRNSDFNHTDEIARCIASMTQLTHLDIREEFLDLSMDVFTIFPSLDTLVIHDFTQIRCIYPKCPVLKRIIYHNNYVSRDEQLASVLAEKGITLEELCPDK